MMYRVYPFKDLEESLHLNRTVISEERIEILRQIKLVKRDGLGSWGRMGIMVFNATFNNISVTLCWGSKEKNEHKYNKSNYNGVPFKMRKYFVLKSHLVPSCRNVNRIKAVQHHRDNLYCLE